MLTILARTLNSRGNKFANISEKLSPREHFRIYSSHFLKTHANNFLAHLSQRLIGELIVYSCSGVRRRCRCCRQPFSNIFTSETAWPVKAKFYTEPLWQGETKVYINGPDHMTKMTPMPIYGKHLQNILLQNRKF